MPANLCHGPLSAVRASVRSAKSDPTAIIWALLVEAYYIKLLTKFCKLKPYGYVQRDLASFSYVNPCKDCHPEAGQNLTPEL